MIGEQGFAERRQPVGRRFRSWCDGRQDALALKPARPRPGHLPRWYEAGHRYTAVQIRQATEPVQLRLDVG